MCSRAYVCVRIVRSIICRGTGRGAEGEFERQEVQRLAPLKFRGAIRLRVVMQLARGDYGI